MTGLIFASPVAGILALLGIPAVLAIHFLQTPSRPVAVSTLFLLDRLDPKSTGGRRFERLRQSLPLWLQLLSVLLLAWLIAEPRWIRKDSTQTVLVLLDSSVSMRAFEAPLHEILPARLRTLARSAAHTEWLLLETDPAAERLYAGGRLEDMDAALRRWRPRLGMHDIQPALQAGLSLLRGRGVILFVTDHEVPVPPGVELLAIGHAIENVGFCGVRVTADGWEALMSNFGTQTQKRAWHMEDSEGKSVGPERALELPPGGSETIRGKFPDGVGKMRVVLNRDEFPLDDVLPLVRPESKRVRVQVEGGAELGDWLEPFLRSETALDRVSEAPNLRLAGQDFSAPIPAKPTFPAILFCKEAAPPSGLCKGTIVAERDPLIKGLNWDGLIVAGTASLPLLREDNVLLWMDQRPLIFRRGTQLVMAFDVAHSNAPRLPAFVLLLHRYAESVRFQLAAPETANFETNQTLDLVRRDKVEALRAPAEPGFFEAGDEKAKLIAAAHFADPRESDFRHACSADPVETLAQSRRERYSEADARIPVWVLFLGVVMAWNWVKTDGRRET
ncbi:MAG: BatA domain-containing protein [Chthoniobacteraceae bacterium]